MFTCGSQRGKIGVLHSSLACVLVAALAIGCGGVEQAFVENSGKAEKKIKGGYEFHVSDDDEKVISVISKKDPDKRMVITLLPDDAMNIKFMDGEFLISAEGDVEVLEELEDSADPEEVMLEITNATAMLMETFADDTDEITDYLAESMSYDGMDPEGLRQTAIGFGVAYTVFMAGALAIPVLVKGVPAVATGKTLVFKSMLELSSYTSVHRAAGIFCVDWELLALGEALATATVKFSAVKLFYTQVFAVVGGLMVSATAALSLVDGNPDSMDVGTCDATGCQVNDTFVSFYNDIDALP